MERQSQLFNSDDNASRVAALDKRRRAAADDYAQAMVSADDGIEQSAETAGDEWLAYATRFLKSFLQSHPIMHVDQLWLAGLEEPDSARGLGQVIRKAATDGSITKIVTAEGWICAKESARSNCQLKAVWRSRVCHGK